MMSNSNKNNNVEAQAMENQTKANNNKEESTMRSNINTESKKKGNTMNSNTGKKKTARAKVDENNKGMENAGALDATTFDNLTEIIPENEHAITKEDSHKIKKLSIVSSIEPQADITSEISEDEREALELPMTGLANITKCGCFAPVAGMKCLITDTGHTFFAKRYKESKKEEVIKLCQQYKNGAYSELMEINKADLVSAAFFHFMSKDIPESAVRSSVSKFIMEVTRDYYGKLLYLKEGLDIRSILNMLMEECDGLPLETQYSILEQPEKLYSKVLQIIKDKQLDAVDEHEAYYTLSKDQLETIVRELDVKRSQLLKQLREYRFLYLTDASNGYQTCVRFKPCGEFFPASYTEWCYCILKLDYLARKRLENKTEK